MFIYTPHFSLYLPILVLSFILASCIFSTVQLFCALCPVVFFCFPFYFCSLFFCVFSVHAILSCCPSSCARSVSLSCVSVYVDCPCVAVAVFRCLCLSLMSLVFRLSFVLCLSSFLPTLCPPVFSRFLCRVITSPNNRPSKTLV